MRHAIFRAGLLGFLLLAVPASAQTSTDVCRSSLKLLEQVNDALRKGGLARVEPLAPAMQKAVSEADVCFPSVTNPDDTVTILADGSAESLMALLSIAATNEKTGKKVKGSAQLNPFPQIAFILGSYYNEIGKPQDALRVLDRGLSLSPFPSERLGELVLLLIAEKGAALNALKRFEDAVQNYDEGLRLPKRDDAERARLHRGRGFSLIELNRLDDAEKAYREALKLEPGDTRARHELAYIAGLRGGAAKTEGYFTTVAPPAADKDVPHEQRAKKPDAPN
jgi:tetratricopeptide (TPR) repeat protein